MLMPKQNYPFYHGVFLIASVFIFPGLLEAIPLASLAAILILIGIKLVKINEIIRQFRTQWENGLVIVVTICSFNDRFIIGCRYRFCTFNVLFTKN